MTTPLTLQPGDIVLVHGAGPISVSIEAITRSMFSHVALVADAASKQLIEAQWGRTVGYQPLDYYAGHTIITRVPNLTLTQRAGIVEYAHSKFGTPYDYFALVAEFERYVFHRPLTPEEHGRLICSSLVADAYRSIGVMLSDERIASPGDIWDSPLPTIVGRY